MRFLGLCGSLRRQSVNDVLLRYAGSLVPPGVTFERYPGVGRLPLFDPDLDPDGTAPPAAVAALREAAGRADAVIIATPEYARVMSAATKNALEWLIGGGQLSGTPVAVLTASPSPAGGRLAAESVLAVLEMAGAHVVPAACRSIGLATTLVRAGALVDDHGLTTDLTAMMAALQAHVHEAQVREAQVRQAQPAVVPGP